jgi:hypothetical protein
MNIHSALSFSFQSILARPDRRRCRQLAPLALAGLLLSTLGCQPATNSTAGSRGNEAPETAKADTDSADDAADEPAVSVGSSTDPGAGDVAAGPEPQTPAPSGGDHEGPGLAASGANRGASRPSSSGEGEAIEIVFEDIQLPIQADMVFRPFMLTERVQELDGQRIRIHGYMLPDSKTRGITQFVLLKNTECKFGPGGQADHLINVLMTNGVTARYRDDPITVEGVLKVNPFQGPDGNTWSIYDLACDKVETYRRR